MIDNLWAGWRMNFLQQSEGSVKLDSKLGCILCQLSKGGGEDFDKSNYVVFRGDHCYVVLNAFPYAAGHMMIVPNVHEGDLLDLDRSITTEATELTRTAIAALREIYDPEGFNVGANLGRAGGAAFGDHIHFHVVPRWLGDTNFMTTLAHARVIPEALSSTYERVRIHF